MKSLFRTLLIAVAVTTLTVAWPAKAGDPQPPAKKESTAKKEGAAATKPKPATTPMKGKIDAVDAVARSITVGERTFLVLSTTKITKNGEPALFSDAKVGEECGGAYKTTAEGKLELTSLRVGPKPTKETTAKEKQAPKEKAAK